MERLSQSLRRRDALGNPLPDFLAPLHEAGVRLRRGQVALLVGRPGSGKSLLALFAGLNSGVRTLYISSDTDRATMSWRAAASLMGTTVDEIESMVGTSAHPLIDDAITEVDSKIVFDWSSAPTLEDIRLEVHAAEETWGSWPELVILDSLYSVASEYESYAGYEHTMQAMHSLAHETGAAVLVLHHASLNRGSADEPATMQAVIGQVTKIPSLVLSVLIDEEEGKEMTIGVVKNRMNSASVKARKQVRIPADVSRMRLYASEQERAMAESRRSWE